MNNRLKNILITICFLLIIFGFMVANIIIPDNEISYSERRRLSQVPDFSLEDFLEGDYFKSFEYYIQDQFVFRDAFRSLKAFTRYNLFLQKENNDMYIAEGHISKMLYPLKEDSVFYAAQKLNKLKNDFFRGNNVYFSVVPDKNYFLASRNGYLSMDYDKMLEIMKNNISGIEYIDIINILELNDYYRTDIHWSQDKILKVADKLLEGMGNPVRASGFEYKRRELYPFYGSYYGHAAVNFRPDNFIYLTNNTIESAEVYDPHYDELSNVYMPDKFEGIDPYDVFLSGARAVLIINNDKCTTGKELVIFRDSFGSSIAPLLLEGYSKIILIDLRYIASTLLERYVEFNENQDVLFLYNTEVINNSAMLK